MSYKDNCPTSIATASARSPSSSSTRSRRAIASGELAPGEQLPPTRELAELAGVNHLTAVRAYRRLRELGLVSAHVGRGTFVRGAAAPARDRPGRRLDRLAALRAARVRAELSATRCSPRCTARRPPRT